MLLNYGTLASLAFTFATLGNGHLIMKTPVPFGVSTLNNSPLVNADPFDSGSGSDYPCKQRPGVYDITKMNHIAVGAPQELSFIGSASHGGGTCQMAVTMDKEPTAHSVFKLIQVFEGGCPIDSDGNGETHPFTFTLPKGFPNGVSTLAWVWYNRIGDREIYMNCAPMTVTGGSDSKDLFNSLPNMYLINLPTTQCQSTFEFESNAVTIPHPGQYIMKEFSGQDAHAATGPNCSAAAAAQLAGVVGYKSAPIITTNGAAYHAPGGTAAPVPSGSASASGGASGAPSGSAMPSGSASSAAGSAAPSAGASGSQSGAPSSAAGSMSSAAGSAAPSAAPSGAANSSAAGSGIVSISTASSGSAAAGGSAAPSAAPSGSAAAPSGSAAAPSGSAAAPSGSAAAPSSSAAAPSGSAAAPSGSAAPSGGSCSAASAAMSCSSDGKQFGVCSDGKMVWRAVAPGTTCSNGQIQKRQAIRNVHVRRHLQNSGNNRAMEFY